MSNKNISVNYLMLYKSMTIKGLFFFNCIDLGYLYPHLYE